MIHELHLKHLSFAAVVATDGDAAGTDGDTTPAAPAPTPAAPTPAAPAPAAPAPAAPSTGAPLIAVVFCLTKAPCRWRLP